MKKTYITPSTDWVFVHTEAMMAGSAKGGYDNSSISTEGAETMSRRGFSFDDDDMD